MQHVLEHMQKNGAPLWLVQRYFPGVKHEEPGPAVLKEPRELELPAGMLVTMRKPKSKRARKRKVQFKGGQVTPQEYGAMTVAAAVAASKPEQFKPEWAK